jgi:uroporphyrinogen decarboxylase
MTGKERVKRAIRMDHPDRVPILYFNADKDESDIVIADVVRHFDGLGKDHSEWGFTWVRHDETMGQPKETLIKSWGDEISLKIPDPLDSDRFNEANQMMRQYPDKYYLASLVLSGFTVMSALRGFKELLEDLYDEEEQVGHLADLVFGFEEQVIAISGEKGFDGVAFYDDWGTQSSLIISPSMWRTFFKPRYQRQFALAHEKGLDVYFHSCGMIWELIPDLIEIGVDMLNISQPNLYDISKLGSEFGGKVCFVCPVSYQTTAISGNRQDIFNDARALIDHLGKFQGGFVAYVEQYESIGMSDMNYRSCIEAFKKYGKYEN